MKKLIELKEMVERKVILTGAKVKVELINNELHIKSNDGLLVITTRDNLTKMQTVLNAFAA